ncbi:MULTISPECIES: protein YvfG [Exiguobacterium]|uniref:protein YvfG n=1 Tax=Exiguobacterium TaxID=33986 RepID=UPI001F436A7E|nr:MULTISPECIES: protein YvfG [Exiguobacterium]
MRPVNEQLFTTERLMSNFREYTRQNEAHMTTIQALNAYYKVVAGSILADRIAKNADLIVRMRHLEEAYQKVAQEAR